MKLSKICLACTSVLALAPAWANTSNDPAVETIVVTGDRFAQNADSVLAPITILDRTALDQIQAQSLTDALRTLPNVDINQYGGRGQNASVSVRGATSTQTLVLVDGVRLARSVIGSVDINAIPLAQIERIEFIRGARAALYGSEAISGVINIITRGGESGTVVKAGAGSLGHVEASVRSVLDVAGGQLKAVAAWEEQDGYNVHPVPGVNDGDKHGFAGKSALLAYDRNLTEQFSVYGGVRWNQNTSQYDNSSVGNPDWGTADTHERKENWQESFDYQLQAQYQSERWLSQVQAQTSNTRSYDYVDTLSHKDAPAYSHLRQHNLAWLNQLQFNDSVSFGAGVDWRREELRGDSTQEDWMTGQGSPFAPETLSRDNTGVFALSRFEQGGHQLEASLRSDDNQQFGRHNTWQVGGALALAPQWRLVASVGTAFRAPTFFDLYYPGSQNPELKPESSDNYELALEGKALGAELRLGWFRQDATDLLQWDNSTYRMENIGEALIDGIELEAQFETGWVAHQLSYGWRDSEDKISGNQLTASARHNAKWNLSADIDSLNLTANLVYRGSRYGDAANTVELDSYFLVNLAASYSVTESLILRARLENALDEDYLTIADTFSGGSYPGQGRTGFAAVEYRF
ncbi:TonB-dependent receptor domain-containing protein [Ferrimonas pelagia]|uniref:TonB-dependent receptor n=1 Tax=Ferrimonas pelagia TaxID=1177826 RepID=A0ABP9FIU9_9GAMM